MPASSLPSIAASQLHIAPPTNQLRVLQVELESVASDLCQLTLSGICLAGLGSGAHGLCAYHHFSSDSATSLAVTLSAGGSEALAFHQLFQHQPPAKPPEGVLQGQPPELVL